MKYLLIFVAAFCSITLQAQLKISEMPTLPGNPNGSYIPIVQGSNNFKVNASQIGVNDVYVRNDSVIKLKQGQEVYVGNIAMDSTLFAVETIEQMMAIPLGSKQAIIVKDSLRGGLFRKATSGVTVDSGIVFPAAGGGYAVRDISQAQGVNVKWFGAKGDGVTDDYIALKKWADFLSAHAGTGIIPDGTFLSSGSVKIWGNDVTVRIKGILKSSSTTGINLLHAEAADSVSSISNITIIGEGGTIDGNRVYVTGYTYTAGYVTTYDALRLRNVDKYTVENLIIKNGLVSTVRALGCRNGIIRGCDISGAVHDNGISCGVRGFHAGI